MTQPIPTDRWRSRAIDDQSNDPRMVVARLMSRRRSYADIPPGIWAEAGAIVRELRAAGLLVDRRDARNKNAAKEKT